MTSRATAALVIDKVLRHGAALDEPLAQALATVPPKDRPLVQQLAYGTLRQSYRLQASWTRSWPNH